MTPVVFAQSYRCDLYAQNPQRIQVSQGQVLERQVEVVYTNSGTTNWQNTGGVTNLQYIELRSCDSQGVEKESIVYHSSWINRKRVGSYLSIQGDVSPSQRARFVFTIRIDARQLSVGIHRVYVRPYHANGHWIADWGNMHFEIEVTQGSPSGVIPSASIQSISPNPAQMGQVIQFSGTATESPSEYRWEINGALLSTRQQFSSSFTPGTYQISFKAKNTYGWSNVVTQSLVIQNASSSNQLIASIQSLRMERTNPQTFQGEMYDLLRVASPSVRSFRLLQGVGSTTGSNPVRHEWSFHENGRIHLIDLSQSVQFYTSSLPKVQGELCYRAQDANGNWSAYAKTQLKIESWPLPCLPVNGDWQRSGNNYSQGDHIGYSAIYAQDFNQSSGGASNDFGREILATLDGVVEVKSDPCAGHIVDIISDYTSSGGQKYRTRYMHLSTVLVQNQDHVIQGQPIGSCGNTGNCSTASHLHYVMQVWEGSSWKSILPEPVKQNSTVILQTLDYARPFNASNLTWPNSILVLPETYTGVGFQDLLGWGQSKIWGMTTSQSPPTIAVHWDITIPSSGTWKLYMHNPSGNTHSLNGIATHNTTSNAQFELTYTGASGYSTYSVDQQNSKKGAFIEITTISFNAGDRLMITQHNATGESNREISFDDLMLVQISQSGGGGSQPVSSSGGTGSGSIPAPAPSPMPNPVPTTPTSQPNPNTSPASSTGSSIMSPQGGGGSGSSGGCSISLISTNTPALASLVLMLLLGGFLIRHRNQ